MARGAALAAAIAVSLLAVSGAGGAATQQAPKRGGTLVIRVLGPEPACLNVLPMSCNLDLGQAWGQKVLQAPFDVGPDFTYEESLVSRVDFTRRRPFTLTYHIRPEARWSDGVPVTAQDFIFTLQAIRRHASRCSVTSTPRSEVRGPWIARPCESFSGRGPKLARLLRERPSGARAPRFGSHAGLERPDRRSADGTTDRKRPVPRRAARARKPARAPAQLPLLGTSSSLRRAARRQIRAVGYRSQRRAEERRARRGHGRSTSGRPGRSSAAGAALGHRHGRRISSTSTSSSDRTVIRRSATSSFAARSRMESTARRSSDRYGARSIPPLAPSTAPCTSPRAATTGQTGRLPLSTGRGPPPARESGLPQGRRRNLLLWRTAAVVALRDRRRICHPSPGTLANPDSASGCRGRGQTGVRTPGTFIGQILPKGRFEVALFSWGNSPAYSWAGTYGCGGADNHNGYCQRLVTAHLNQADRILDDRRRASVLNEADRGLARDVPTIPLFQFVAAAAYDTSVRNFVFVPWNPLWNAENWWLER